MDALLQGVNASESFRELWIALREYRRNNLTDKTAFRILASSPWILPDWREDILTQCREELSFGTVDPVETVLPPFMEEPRLRWESGQDPRWETSTVNLVGLSLKAEGYSILLNGRQEARILRRGEGHYEQVGDISLDGRQPDFLATLVDSQGSAVDATPLVVWRSEEELNLWDLASGGRMDPWENILRPRRAYALLASEDFKLMVGDRELFVEDRIRYPQARRTLYRLSCPLPEDFRLTLEGDEFWAPLFPSRRRRTPTPDWFRGVLVDTTPSRACLGELFRIRIRDLGPEVEIRGLRLDGRPMHFDCYPGRVLSEPIPVTAGLALGRGKVFLSLYRGREYCGQIVPVGIRASGILRRDERKWSVVRDSTETVSRARKQIYKILLPEECRGEGWEEPVLMEGTLNLGRMPERASSLPALAGYGAPLLVQPQAYNCFKTPHRLFKEIHHPGILQAVKRTPHGGLLLRLDQALTPSSEHEVVLWCEDGSLKRASGEEIETIGENDWRFGQAVSSGTLVVAVAFRGKCLGAVVLGKLSEFLQRLPARESTQTAALLRWFHLPLRALPNWQVLGMQRKECGADTLRAWIFDEGLPRGLSYAEASAGWRALVCEYATRWKPVTTSDVFAVLGLGQDRVLPGDDFFLEQISRLLNASPILLYWTFGYWIQLTGVRRRKGGKLALQRQVQRRVACLPGGAGHEQIQEISRSLRMVTAFRLGIDEAALERRLVPWAIKAVRSHGSARGTDPRQERNLQIALQVEAFRRHLALELLDTVVKPQRRRSR
jgi:hypothetical protein